ncbi:Uncharacterised protein [uncultured archaeon]|nr:Uncharacterised protein [uncultured archaeon]
MTGYPVRYSPSRMPVFLPKLQVAYPVRRLQQPVIEDPWDGFIARVLYQATKKALENAPMTTLGLICGAITGGSVAGWKGALLCSIFIGSLGAIADAEITNNNQNTYYRAY